jgi:DNA-binding XRE family transcriptional regulator
VQFLPIVSYLGVLMSFQIKMIRQKLLMTQSEFAQKLSMSKQMISNYENGLYKPSMTVIKKLIKIAKDNDIDINVDDFFKD